MRVEQKTKVDGKSRPEFDSTVWADPEGQVLKSEQDIFGGVVMYRTTEDAAKSPGGPIQFDMIKHTFIKIGREIPNVERARLVKYRLKLKNGIPAEAIAVDSRQSLQPGPEAGSAILEVKRVGPQDGEPGPPEVDPQYLKPNAILTSMDKQVRSLAERATRGIDDPWEKAKRINNTVYKFIRKKNFEVAFAAASEVARTRSGDCTEHAVLAAAMCRAVEIPSRPLWAWFTSTIPRRISRVSASTCGSRSTSTSAGSRSTRPGTRPTSTRCTSSSPTRAYKAFLRSRCSSPSCTSRESSKSSPWSCARPPVRRVSRRSLPPLLRGPRGGGLRVTNYPARANSGPTRRKQRPSFEK